MLALTTAQDRASQVGRGWQACTKYRWKVPVRRASPQVSGRLSQNVVGRAYHSGRSLRGYPAGSAVQASTAEAAS